MAVGQSGIQQYIKLENKLVLLAWLNRLGGHGMLHAKAYIHDEKARPHERLPALAEEIGARSSRTDVELDSYIISATTYEDLCQRYDDGTWDRERFAEKHILFQERSLDYDYMKRLFAGS